MAAPWQQRRQHGAVPVEGEEGEAGRAETAPT
eukprot:CAMPEP_0171984190 /NCGR_PEP_ID=MMETSP0993-20121228/273696_1 /TAXON_ID=483369 /ORGANISM="non described non described, Strain CCMP2098" /LENGTH=31 /DNA_ID= /DNA_START= /DNA_END= /DNA_ORIENTATION=